MKILSISCEQDAGAIVNIDGKIVAAVNEERFNRKKLYIGFPELSIITACNIANVKFNDFNYIAVSTLNHISSLDYDSLVFHQKVGEVLSKFKPFQLALRTDTFTNLVKNFHRLLQSSYRNKTIKKLRELGFKQPIYFIDHHTCHAAGAYFTSGWKDALIVTLDGAGDGVCSRVFATKEYKLKEVHNVPFYGSPGYYYSYATNVCGFKYGREGKLTGLAAYGNPAITKHIYESRIKYDPLEIRFVNYGHYFNNEINYLKEALKGCRKEDIAAGIQEHTEELVIGYIKDLIKKYNKSKSVKLALCGGVFSNVKLNQKISELAEIEEIYVYPHMGDGGLAAGASFALLQMLNYPVQPYELNNVYLGTKYNEKDILHALKLKQIDFSLSADPAFEIARAIKNGKVVAYFNNAMEYGPRALGNRSIFVSAKDPSINQWLNAKLQRSDFMPFAPIILKENESDYFLDIEKKQKCTRFMTITSNVTQKAIKDIPAAIHVDGTARYQAITKEQNPTIYKMLKIHNAITGVPAVINTSFNMHEEPIVESPADAIESFLKGHLDMLVLGNYVIDRKDAILKDGNLIDTHP